MHRRLHHHLFLPSLSSLLQAPEVSVSLIVPSVSLSPGFSVPTHYHIPALWPSPAHQTQYLKTELLAQDGAVHWLDNGILIQVEFQGLSRTARTQQGLMGVRLLKTLHQPGPGRQEVQEKWSGPPPFLRIQRPCIIWL